MPWPIYRKSFPFRACSLWWRVIPISKSFHIKPHLIWTFFPLTQWLSPTHYKTPINQSIRKNTSIHNLQQHSTSVLDSAFSFKFPVPAAFISAHWPSPVPNIIGRYLPQQVPILTDTTSKPSAITSRQQLLTTIPISQQEPTSLYNTCPYFPTATSHFWKDLTTATSHFWKDHTTATYPAYTCRA